MNHSRRDKFSKAQATFMADVDNEIQMLVDSHNTHDTGLVGWTALSLKDGSNKRMGQAVLVAGTLLVANTTITANTRVFLSHANTSGTLGILYVSARVAGTSFTIASSSATDTSTVNWLLIEPK